MKQSKNVCPKPGYGLRNAIDVRRKLCHTLNLGEHPENPRKKRWHSQFQIHFKIQIHQVQNGSNYSGGCKENSKTTKLKTNLLFDPTFLGGRRTASALTASLQYPLDSGIAGILLASGADIEARTENDEMVVHVSVRRRDVYERRWLARKGVDMLARDKAGR